MSSCKARDLSVGDIFRLHVYGEVLAVTSVADAQRVKIKIALEDQGRRRNHGTVTSDEERNSPRKSPLEFTDTGHVLEFLCPPGRTFRLIYDWWGGDDDDDDVETGPIPSPDDAVPVG